MTTHELAKKLLEGPDVPVVVWGTYSDPDDGAGVECQEAAECVVERRDYSAPVVGDPIHCVQRTGLTALVE